MNKMKRYLFYTALSLAALHVCNASRAQSPFDGTWRNDPARAKLSAKPFTFYLSQGWFHCVSCTPAFDVQADGQFHATPGHSFDSLSVTVVDPRTIAIVARKGDKTMVEQTIAVSADGKVLSIKTTGHPMSGGDATHSDSAQKRIGVAPSGVHATSGNWQSLKYTDSENDLLFTFKSTGEELTMTDPTGDSYTAKFDGSDYPYKGAYGVDAVSLKRLDARTVEETDKRDGKVVYVSKMTVSPDGKTMTIVAHDPQRDTTDTYIATKQK